MNTHIVLTRKVNDKNISIVVPLSTATFSEDTDEQVYLLTDRAAITIEQSMQDIIEMIKPIGFYNK